MHIRRLLLTVAVVVLLLVVLPAEAVASRRAEGGTAAAQPPAEQASDVARASRAAASAVGPSSPLASAQFLFYPQPAPPASASDRLALWRSPPTRALDLLEMWQSLPASAPELLDPWRSPQVTAPELLDTWQSLPASAPALLDPWRSPGVTAPELSDRRSPLVAPDRAQPRARWRWPLSPRPAVLRPFVPPASSWGAGHRGVDLAAAAGQQVLAVAAGRVTHVGMVAGRPTVSVLHGDGIRSTYEPVRATVRVGDEVPVGEPIGALAASGWHCPGACLHLGAIRGEVYLDPLLLLRAWQVRLLPLDGPPARGP